MLGYDVWGVNFGVGGGGILAGVASRMEAKGKERRQEEEEEGELLLGSTSASIPPSVSISLRSVHYERSKGKTAKLMECKN